MFTYSLVTICVAMLLIQMQLVWFRTLTVAFYASNFLGLIPFFFQLHHSDNLAVLLITMIQTFYAFSVMLIACELGQRINIAFDGCAEMINQFDWYLLPAKIQQMLPLIINFAQQPVIIKCLGSAACDRETFKYVSVMKSIIQPQHHFIFY